MIQNSTQTTTNFRSFETLKGFLTFKKSHTVYHIIKRRPIYVCHVKYWKTAVSGNENGRTWFTLLSMQNTLNLVHPLEWFTS
jgi:hypothetical protein